MPDDPEVTRSGSEDCEGSASEDTGSTQGLNKEQLELRRNRALEMRLAGYTFRRIAEQFAVDVRTAWKDVQVAMEPSREEAANAAEQARALELARLDRALTAIWPRIVKGDDFAIDRLVKLSKRRADLLGLDAPEKHEILGAEIILEVVGTEIRQVKVEGQEPEQIEGVQAVVPEEIKALAEPMPDDDGTGEP